MRLTKLAIALAFGLAALNLQTARADGPDDRALYEMLMRSEPMRANGRVTRSDFIKMMEKRFDAMDKNGRREVSEQELRRLFERQRH